MNKKTNETLAGRSLLIYLLPSLFLGIVLMLCAGIYAQYAVSEKIAEQNNIAIKDAAGSLVNRLKSLVSSRREIVEVMTRIDGLAQSLDPNLDSKAANIQKKSFSEYLQVLVPDAQHIEIIAVGQQERMNSSGEQMSYASIDMIKRAIEKGKSPLAEIHQLRSKKPYIAIAMPIKLGDEAVGALLFGYPLALLRQQVDVVTIYPGSIKVVQGDSLFDLASSIPAMNGDADGQMPVPGTLMKVQYQSVVKTNFLDAPLIMAIIACAVILLLALGFLQIKWLSKDLSADMDAVLVLVNALLKRTGAPQPKPKLKVTAPTMLLLGKYAQTVYSNTTQKEGHEKQHDVDAIAPVEQVFGETLPVVDDTSELTQVPANIFRSYDVRGRVDEDLTPEVAQLLGMAMGTLVLEQDEKVLNVIRDNNPSSSDLAKKLVEGILSTGCHVVDLGEAATPLMYFTMGFSESKSGVVVTGSYDNALYNGFKLYLKGDSIIGADLQKLYQDMMAGNFKEGKGKLKALSVETSYLERISTEIDLARPLTVVVDGGNGVAGALAVNSLKSIGCVVVEVNCEPDGAFPNYFPNPTRHENLSNICNQVKANSADIGLAFDIDGDRIALIDNQGNIISNDNLLMFLADALLTKHPGVDVIYDVKSSRHIASHILSHGGRPIMWKSGYPEINMKMKETGALLGADFSGHIFFKDRWSGYDDAIYVGARIVEVLSNETETASEIFSHFSIVPASPEYRIDLAEGEAESVIDKLIEKANFKKANIIKIDGLRIEFANSWGLVKSSDISPALVFRFEADNETALEQVKEKFHLLTKAVLPNVTIPF